VADGLLEHDAGPVVDDADLVQPLADRAEEARGDREVEDAHRVLGVGALLGPFCTYRLRKL